MRILWLKTEFLHPVDKGGRIRTYQMLRHIAREHHVTYLTLDDGTAAPDAIELAREYAHDIVRVPFHPPAKDTAAFFGALVRNLTSSLPYAIARYQNAEMSGHVRRLSRTHDVVVCDFLTPAINLPSDLDIPSVLFQHNVEAMIWHRHAEVSSSRIRRRYMRQQWRRMFAFEREACRRFDMVVAVSPQDAEAMRQHYDLTRVVDIPTGVDLEYFAPSGTVAARRYNIVFTGSMDWMPNDDAMLWFLSEVLPIVRTRVPEVTVTIVGRDPSSRLRQAASTRGITVTGRVPDVRSYMEEASVFVVPIRIGGGTRLKIFEAMAMGLSVVSTSVGAEGLPVKDGVHALIRDDAQGFASAVGELLLDGARRRRIADAAQRMVRENHGWSGVAGVFLSACESVMAREPSTR